jgi:predicted AAA+ superfamily ATPase
MNELLSRGEIEREDMWPRITEYEAKAVPFLFELGLDRLPTEPGLMVVRGPRQYGKSTWLDLELRDTIAEHGAGTAYYLNGDEIFSQAELYQRLIELDAAFSASSPLRRIFIDEITAVVDWERAVKRAYDEGHLRRTLVVTTGSRARDLRRGSERLPGRKGRLARNDYIFLPVSYRQFHQACSAELGDKTWIAYLLSGGAPLAANDIYQFERIPDHFVTMIRDWMLGDVVASGRSRLALGQVLSALFRFGGTPVGFAKLAREAGLANNTVASGYIEQLSDLLCVIPQWQWNAERGRYEFRKPCKLPFVNLAAVTAWHPAALRYVHEFEALDQLTRSMFLEWLVAQEIWRRAAWQGSEPEALGFWKSRDHEIDFVAGRDEWIEVKLGRAGPLEFNWFPKAFPRGRLTVVCATPFETDHIRGVTIHDFLMEGPSRVGT